MVMMSQSRSMRLQLPVAGEVSGAVLIEIGEDVDETMDVQITWSDGRFTHCLVTVELDGGSPFDSGFGKP